MKNKWGRELRKNRYNEKIFAFDDLAAGYTKRMLINVTGSVRISTSCVYMYQRAKQTGDKSTCKACKKNMLKTWIFW